MVPKEGLLCSNPLGSAREVGASRRTEDWSGKVTRFQKKNMTMQ